MTGLIDIRLPDEVMENLPTDKAQMLEYLSKHLDEVLRHYEQRFLNRVRGVMGDPLSRYEKSMLKDFLMDMILGELRSKLEPENPPIALANK